MHALATQLTVWKLSLSRHIQQINTTMTETHDITVTFWSHQILHLQKTPLGHYKTTYCLQFYIFLWKTTKSREFSVFFETGPKNLCHIISPIHKISKFSFSYQLSNYSQLFSICLYQKLYNWFYHTLNL